MLHKRIAHHTRRYVGHVTKYLYERDTILSLLMVFLFIILVKFIPLNLHVLDPMKLAVKDFDLNDIAYAKAGKGEKTNLDSNIVIVNIGHLDREELAYLIEKTASMKPKVMGLDSYFAGPREPHKDSILRSAFEKTENLVVVNFFLEDHHHSGKRELNEDYFEEAMHHRGFGTFWGEDGGTIRYYSPFEKVDNKEYPSFTSSILKLYDEKMYERVEKRHKEVEMINYTRRYNEQFKQYLVLENEDVLLDRVDARVFNGKIVLLAYVSDNPYDIEDKKFTPMNEKFAGKSTPDMNGIIVHANILSMVLEKNYIKKMPEWVGWLVAILIGWLHMSLFIRYYLENHIWFHLVAKIAQLFSAFLFAYLGFRLFDGYGIKLEMELTLVVIILAVDIIYFYEAIAVWMHKKFKFATVFTHHHHPGEGQEHTHNHEHHETNKQ